VRADRHISRGGEQRVARDFGLDCVADFVDPDAARHGNRSGHGNAHRNGLNMRQISSGD
jgi:hypothetical protein